MAQTTTCPGCHLKSDVDEALIGRFVRCEQCHCLYYVVVPPLGMEQGEMHSVAATSSVSGPDATSPRIQRSLTETEFLRQRVQPMIALMWLNLLIGTIILVLTVIQFQK